MPIETLQFDDDKSGVVKYNSISDYTLSSAQFKEVSSRIDDILQRDYWDPVFQAWAGFLSPYFTTGSNTHFMQKYWSTYQQKVDYLIPHCNPKLSLFMSNVIKYFRDSAPVLFDDFKYQEIVEICSNQVAYLVQARTKLSKSIWSEGLYISTMRELLSLQNWRGTVCGLRLFRDRTADWFDWPIDVVQQITDWCNRWCEEFEQEFIFLQNLLQDRPAYSWYCDYVRKLILILWRNAMFPGKVTTLWLADENPPEDILEMMHTYAHGSPSYGRWQFSYQSTWDALCALIYPQRPNDVDFATNAFFILCADRNNYRDLSKLLFDFYNVVKDGKLMKSLITIQSVNYANGTSKGITPEDYLLDLKFRGFPIIEE